jgi:flagellar hook-associated protein 2
MAYNSINSTSIRFTGLASGLDTESIIEQLMTAEKIPVQKVEREKQLAEWKQEQFREITNSLRSFQEKYFNYLNMSTNMLSSSTYKNFSVISSDNTIVKAKGTTDALESNHTITVNNLATSSSIKSSYGITKNIEGTIAADFVSAVGRDFTLNIDGVDHTIEITSDVTDVSSLQTVIDEAVGSNKVMVSDSGGGVLAFGTVEGSGVHKLTVSSGDNDALLDLGFDSSSTYSNRISTTSTLESISSNLKEGFAFVSDQVSFTINGESFTFDKTTTLSSMLSEINSNSNAGVTVKYNELTDKFEIYSDQTGEGHNLKLDSDEGGFFNSVNLSAVTGTSAISDLTAMDFSTGTKYMDLVIDGEKQQISFDTNYSGDADYTNFLSDMEDKIETAYGLSAGSITASLDANNKLNIEIVSGGNSLLITETDTDSVLTTLGLEANYVEGEDAEVLLDGETVLRGENTFTIEGIEYTLLNESSEEQSISLEQDTDAIYDKIVEFVEDYNGLIATLNAKVDEEYDRDYQPLIDEEKEAMSEEEVELWENKAKTGLLRNDPIIEKMLSSMRTALYDSIDNISISLNSIGITTGTYEEKGKLYIDEDVLKAAIEEDADSVKDLFSKKPTNNVSNVRTLNSTERSARYAEEGLAYRIYDILQDNISTYRDNSGYKGFLIEKAGLEGDSSEYTNYLYKEISEYDEEIYDLYDKLAVKEERYYAQFTALESALSKLQSQANYITSMLG